MKLIELKDGGVDIFFDLVHAGQHYDKNMSSNGSQEIRFHIQISQFRMVVVRSQF